MAKIEEIAKSVSTSLSTKSKKAIPPPMRDFNQELGNDVRYDLLEIV